MKECAKKTILLVEDDAIIAITSKRQLEQYGYAVIHVHTGEKAVDAVRTLPEIDLILMDINLGSGIDGTQAAGIILKDRDVPIVFVSSHTEPEVVEKTEKITSYGYVVKATGITVLDSSIKMAFKLFDAKTETQRKDELIRESEKKYRLLHEGAGVGIGYYSPEGIVLSYNKLAAKHMGGVPEDFIGKSIFELFQQPEVQIYLDRLNKASAIDGSAVYEDMVELPTGALYFLSTFTRVCDLGGKLMGIQIISQDMTQRKKAELAIIESNDKFSTLANLAPVGIYLTEPNGDCTYANPAWCKMAGLTLDEARGQGWIRGLHPDDAAMVFSRWNEMVASKGEWGLEYRFRAGDGTVTDVHGLAAAQCDKLGNVVQYVGVNVDITRQKKVESELTKLNAESENNENRFMEMLEIIDDVVVSRDLDNNVIYFNQAFDDVTKKLFSKPASIGMNTLDSLLPEKRAFWEEILSSVKRGEESRIDYSYQLPTGETAYYRSTHAPIMQDGRITGTLELTKDISEYRKIENDLRSSEEKYRAIVENSDDYIMRYDRDCRHIFGNAKALGATGLTAERYFGKTHRDLGFPEHLCVLWETCILEVFDTGLTKTIDFEVELSGEKSFLELKLSPEFDVDGSTVKSVIGISRDITRLKKAQLELNHSQALLKSAEAAGKIGGWEFDTGTLKQTWTEETFRILEIDLSHGEPDVPAGLDFFLPQYRAEVERALQRAIEHGEPYDREWEIITFKGNKKWIRAIGAAYQGEGGTKCLLGSFQDISDRKKADLLLKESELKFKTLANSGRALIWNSGKDKLCNYFNTIWLEFTGRPLEKELGNGWTEGIHPDDVRDCFDTYDKAFDKREVFSMQYRLRRFDGEYRWILDEGCPRYGPDSEFVGYIGHCLDITENKQAENKIRQLLAEKDLILKEVHHRIKNNMNTVSSFLTLQAQSLENLASRRSFDDATRRIQSMVLLYDKLYRSADFTELSVKDYLPALVDQIIANFPESGFVKGETSVDDFMLDVERLQPVGIIVNELITNSMKYAFKGRDSGLISVSIRRLGKLISVTVRDDGIGMPEQVDFANTPGFGLQLVQGLTDQLNGTISIERGKGARVLLEFEA